MQDTKQKIDMYHISGDITQKMWQVSTKWIWVLIDYIGRKDVDFSVFAISYFVGYKTQKYIPKYYEYWNNVLVKMIVECKKTYYYASIFNLYKIDLYLAKTLF